jgi:hypothetical protein
MKTNLKRLMAAATVAALSGSPALAASHVQRHVPQAPYAASGVVTAPDGRAIGADPDPSVRLDMRRDSGAYTGQE